MAVEVHVEGRIVLGGMPEFIAGVRRYREYAGAHGYAVPRVLQGLSGPMNTVRLVFSYPELSAYERDEARTATDREYGQVAGAMPFVDGTLTYSVFHVVEDGAEAQI